MATARDTSTQAKTAKSSSTKKQNKKETAPSKTSSKIDPIEAILNSNSRKDIRGLFAFDSSNTDEEVLFKFAIWARWFYPKFFKAKDAPFHADIDLYNLQVYRGKVKSFTNIVFRGGAKTTRTKLFVAYVITNDIEHKRKYYKILTKDLGNAKQIVTDVYNMLINQRVAYYYPETFEKTIEKREETMSSFTTATGIKIRAGTVGMDQRGQLQEDARPDFIWFDDFETRKTLRSAVETQAIWDNMEEARTGLSRDGGCVYTCNYLSERGNVHKLVGREDDANIVLVVPIIYKGQPMWSVYTIEEIKQIERDADDFAGEYLCEPAAGADIFFDRRLLDDQVERTPIREVGGFKMFFAYDPSHRYGGGHDVAGGVGLDSSTSVFIDFSTTPSRVVATFKSNNIKPDTFGDEIKREADYYGACIVAPESNNHGHATIGRLKQIYDNIFFQEEKETRAGFPGRTRYYGWHTNADTKPKMLFALKKAVEDGHLQLSDPDLKAELRSYTRDDLMDKDEDVRLTTRHFDLLMAAAIAYQMKDWAEISKESAPVHIQAPYERPGLE